MIPHQQPWWPNEAKWEEAWALIQKERGYGFYDGGCLILAEALKMILSGSRVGTVLVRGRVDHYVVCLPNGQWADAGGIAGKVELLERYRRQELSNELPEHMDAVDRIIRKPEIPRSMRLSRRIAEILNS